MIRFKSLLTKSILISFFIIRGGVPAVCNAGDVTLQNYLSTIQEAIRNPSALNDLISKTTSTASSANSALTSASENPKYNSTGTNDLLTSYNPREHTMEFLAPVKFSPISEKESLLPVAEQYAVTICISYNNIKVSNCSDIKTPLEASQKIASMVLNKHFKGTEIRPLKIVMSLLMPQDEQTQLLYQIETDAIKMIEAYILEELKSSNEYAGDTPETKQQKHNFIMNRTQIAVQEAQSGNDWSHNSKEDRTIHTFLTQKVFKQFENTILTADSKKSDVGK
jgi:hypothetical protein